MNHWKNCLYELQCFSVDFQILTDHALVELLDCLTHLPSSVKVNIDELQTFHVLVDHNTFVHMFELPTMV